MTDIIICDIDGTLADATHRLHMLPAKTYPNGADPGPAWEKFFTAAKDDVPHPEVAWLLRMLADRTPFILVTGRPEHQRQDTIDWLDRHEIPFFSLFMRPTGDHRHDTVVKSEILHRIRSLGFKPMFALEDRASVVAMWRAEGVPCMQVRPGDF